MCVAVPVTHPDPDHYYVERKHSEVVLPTFQHFLYRFLPMDPELLNICELGVMLF